MSDAPAPKRSSKRVSNRIAIHLRRIEAHMQVYAPDGTPRDKVPIRVTIKDLSLTGLGVFFPRIIPPSDSVEIQFEGLTKPLSLKGRVVWCSPVQQSKTRILTPESFLFRGGIEFMFKTKEEERTLVKEYERLARELMTGLPEGTDNAAVTLSTEVSSTTQSAPAAPQAAGDIAPPAAPTAGITDSNIDQAAALLDQMQAGGTPASAETPDGENKD